MTSEIELTELEKEELDIKIQYFVDRDLKIRLIIKRIIHGMIFGVGMFLLCVLLFFAGRYLLMFDRSISGLVSIVLTLVFQFIPPVKQLWKKFVVDCQVK